jgi:hypothetical protein
MNEPIIYQYKALRKVGKYQFGDLLTRKDYLSLSAKEKKDIQGLKSPIVK